MIENRDKTVLIVASLTTEMKLILLKKFSQVVRDKLLL